MIACENGRSSLEILAVLSLMGILSVTAFYGYNHLTRKYKATTVIQDARMIHALLFGQAEPSPSNWEDANISSVFTFQKMIDMTQKPYVKVVGINKDICQQLLPLATDKKLEFYNDSNEKYTHCSNQNDIILAFDNVGPIAQCLHATDCGDENYDGICDSQNQCKECEDLTTRNEEGSECICNTDIAVSCETEEGDKWCCEKGKLCSDSPNECLNASGCWYSFSATKTENRCHYTVESDENDMLTVVPDTSFHQCREGQYCNLQYANEDLSGRTTDGSLTSIWGICNDPDTNLGVWEIEVFELTPVHPCPSRYYCYLKWKNQQCQSTQGNENTIYGQCLDLEQPTPSCPDQWEE